MINERLLQSTKDHAEQGASGCDFDRAVIKHRPDSRIDLRDSFLTPEFSDQMSTVASVY
jgi:hypothetical protein